ncbi:hypothetical protein [Mammaliicoccus sciuri]|uniref:hypothetical protein n=1 Tax=Mammaliicoccus sciuri TaxID=1296 RepID=UPI001E50BC32|nr:hypothetical protein [Mammaliicoccus sciuri]MCD8846342.1 hypothetical protein [Mammaliicoccus sciuri]
MKRLNIIENYVIKKGSFSYDVKILEINEGKEESFLEVLISSHGVQKSIRLDRDEDVHKEVENYIEETFSKSPVLKENGQRNFER